MSQTIPYVEDLRTTAATIASQHITARWRDSTGAVPYPAIEAGLDAATPFMIDAFLIQEALAVVESRTPPTPRVTTCSAHKTLALAGGNRYRYLQNLQREGWLCLRTLDLKYPEDEDGEDLQG